MGRAPCCEKMGLKKGPWSPEEDRILISYIENFGHANWRALPKQAGLLRCGKSCRLRWMNYLRPDIKRGNFSREEEENIIKLHELLGNRWSAIAARLPGRTDNEIKNVWHTHLKKRLKQSQEGAANLDSKKKSSRCNSESKESPQPSSSSDFSSLTDASNAINMEELMQSSMELLPPIDESFWSDISSLPAEYSPIYDESIGIQIAQNFPASSGESNHLQFPPNFSNVMNDGINSFSTDDGMDFWCELFINSGEIPEF